LKLVGGGLSAATGIGICTTGLGCAAGVPMAAIGASEAWQGGEMLWDATRGVASEGFNLIKSGFQKVNPEWGGIAYETTALTANLASLVVKVPLVVGASDGIERATSLFGAVATRWNNASEKLGVFVSKELNQLMLTGSAAGRGVALGQELNNR
jgi:filamentous hemagglutinin